MEGEFRQADVIFTGVHEELHTGFVVGCVWAVVFVVSNMQALMTGDSRVAPAIGAGDQVTTSVTNISEHHFSSWL